MKEIRVYTDGSNSVEARVIGYAFKLIFPAGRIIIRAGAMKDQKGTSDRAELMAVLRALQELDDNWKKFISDKKILIVSDSQYVVKCGGGIFGRHTNFDLWNQIDKYLIVEDKDKHGYIGFYYRPEINFKWTKGHHGNHHNNEVDELARVEMLKLKGTLNGNS